MAASLNTCYQSEYPWAANSFDEWSPLREVIVGTSAGLRGYHVDVTFRAFHWDNIKEFLASEGFRRSPWHSIEGSPIVPLDEKIITELKEDIEDFALALKATGIRVHRPSGADVAALIVTPYWSSQAYGALNVRDQTIVLGNTLVETASHERGRIFENDALKSLFYDYFNAGSRWIAMPRPTLAKGTVDNSYHRLASTGDIPAQLNEDTARSVKPPCTEIIFDGAQCLRFGKDILVNAANKNHRLGVAWLQREFSETYRVHMLDGVSDGHIDSLLMPLRPGVLLVRHKSIVEKLPLAFRTWTLIEAPLPKQDLFPDYSQSSLAITSKYIDLNVLSISPDTVVVNSLYPDLIRVLESHHFTVVPVRHRHRRIAGGGFHCFTLDTVRDCSLESYL